MPRALQFEMARSTAQQFLAMYRLKWEVMSLFRSADVNYSILLRPHIYVHRIQITPGACPELPVFRQY